MEIFSFVKLVLEQQIKTIVGLLTGAVVTWLVTTLTSYSRFRRFRSVFGSAVRDSEDIILSLPQWTLSGEKSGQTVRFERTNPSGRIFRYYGPSRMLAKDDVMGASLLISLIAEVLNKPAVIVSDGDLARFVNKTAIIFGSPIVNFHAAEIAKMRVGKPLPIEFVERPIGPEGQNVIVISHPKTGKEYRKDEHLDTESFCAVIYP